MEENKKQNARQRLLDILIVIIFLLIAAVSIEMFRRDLNNTIKLQNVEPVGTVVVKKNIVQRRLGDRVLWDRLAYESPVYLWDLIRVAEISAATLHLQGNSIDLDENTLIRITPSPDGGGLMIELSGGSLSVAAYSDSKGISIDMNGSQVYIQSGSVLNASAGDYGSYVQVIEGSAVYSDNTGRREITSGGYYASDKEGKEVKTKAAVVTSFAANARYLKESGGPADIEFLWNRVNLDPDEKLRLEISGDREFKNIAGTAENLDMSAFVTLNAGTWHWRLLSADTVVGSGRIDIAENAVRELSSPAANSIYRYLDDPPVINFQWNKIEEAVSYILEIYDAPDFSRSVMRKNTPVNSISISGLGEGTWHWRVMPVFPDIFGGRTEFSASSVFKVEQGRSEFEYADFNALFAMESPLEYIPPDEIIVPAPVINVTPALSVTPTLNIAPLSAPRIVSPAGGTAFGIEDILSNNPVEFIWSSVQDANAYIFTLYRQSESGRILVLNTEPLRRTSYVLDNLKILDRGNFIWQAEAVVTGANNSIERRSPAVESGFIIDFPVPGEIIIDDTGILYGN